jgi:hypothetical protein
VAGIATRKIREWAIDFRLDHRAALANRPFRAWAIKHLDAATAVADESRPLQIPGGFDNPFAAHGEHVRDYEH